MESQICHQPAGSGGWEEPWRFRKGTMASTCLDARHFSSFLCATCAFQAATLVLELRGSESELVSLCVNSFKGTAFGSSIFFHWLNPCWFLQPEVMGTYLLGTGTLGWGASCGAGTPCSWEIPPEFLSTTCEWGTGLFHVCAAPTTLDVVFLIPQ